MPDTTRLAHLQSLIARYLNNPGNARFSAEQVSRVAYNAGPGALGDYTASTHTQGEAIGVVLDLRIRDATDGARSMDDVMRLMNERFGGKRGFTGEDIERAVAGVCGCSVRGIFDAYVRAGNPIDFNAYLAPLGLRATITRAPALQADGAPAKDLRIWGYETASEQGVRLVISDPASVWGRAGLHTNDRLVAVNGASITTWPEFRAVLVRANLGDTLGFEYERADGQRMKTSVVVSGFDRPVVRIEAVAQPTERQRRLLQGWLESAQARADAAAYSAKNAASGRRIAGRTSPPSSTLFSRSMRAPPADS